MSIKALSLTQPWATLVAIGAKRIETRSWATAYRGPLAIHAAKGLGPVGGWRGLRDLAFGRSEFRQALIGGLAPRSIESYGDLMAALPLGAIVAVCRVCAVTCIEQVAVLEKSPNYVVYGRAIWADQDVTHIIGDQERAFGNYEPGRYAWLLADIRALATPIPCRGALSLWDVPADVERQIEEQLS